MIRKISILTFGVFTAVACMQGEVSARSIDGLDTQISQRAESAAISASAKVRTRVAINPQPLPPHGGDPE